MPHRHRVRDIAEQAGISQATVDRVLHRRAGVSPRAERAVERAVAELDRQARQVSLTGRRVVLDLVMTAPARFTDAVRAALEGELPLLRPASVRLRSVVEESSPAARTAERLLDLARRGSDGILLKAPDDAAVREAVDAVVAAGIPVVTLVTDLPSTARHAYVGVDNAAAGATAAYLLDLALGARSAAVVVPLSRAAFLGEDQRARGFAAEFARIRGGSSIRIDETDGLDATMQEAVARVLTASADVAAVYSVGGANRGVLAAFDAAGRRPLGYVAHDLDGDNLDLLREGRLTAVLHHDLRHDARRALRAVLQVRGLLPGAPHSLPSSIDVVTPHNIPAARRW